MHKYVLLALLGIIAFGLGRSVRYRSLDAPIAPAAEVFVSRDAAERLATSLRFATISNEDPAAFDGGAFRSLHAHLRRSFSRVHGTLRVETVAEHSLLFTWPGTDPSLDAILLAAHLDVVPIEPGTERGWHHPAFGGTIADGFVWGRGAIDNKSAVLGILEAVEMLLGEGHRPARTVYLAFGHDEEVGGTRGARAIARLLERRKARLEMVLDEGGVIGDGILPGISAPVALVGVAEKGFVSIELSARAPGGHSSLPPTASTIGILGAAIARLESDPMPARLDGPTRQLFDRIGRELSFGQRLAFANLWLTEPVVTSKLEKRPTTNAMVRTTMAATVFQAGTKDNVLPSHARAVLNFRILPGDSMADVEQHVRRVVDDDRVETRVVGRFSAEPSAIASTDSISYRRLERTIQSTIPGAIVAPYTVVVATDARHYASLGKSIFRFLPVRLAPEDIARMHGTNERLAIRDYERAIRFYRRLLLDTTAD